MLQSIRDYTHGWIASIIISLLILSFALWGIHSYLMTVGSSNTVAKVNGVEITKGQLAMAYERFRRQLQSEYSANYQLPEREESTLKHQALQTLIDIQVLRQGSLNEDYRITQEQVTSFLRSIPEFQVNGEFSIDRFQQSLATTLFSTGEFLDMLKTTLLIDQPKLGVILTSYALPNEIENSLALVGQQRNIQYVSITQDYFAKQPVSISDQEIQSYYDAHQNDYKTPEQVSISYIEMNVNDLAAKIHPADNVLKDFYNENSNSFAVPAQWQVDELLIPIVSDDEAKQVQSRMNDILNAAKAGKSFADVAKQNSDIKAVEKLQPWATLAQMPAELQKAVSVLTKTGLMSDPITTSKGIVLLKVQGYKEAVVQPYDKVKDKVRDAYTHQQVEEQFGDLREKMANSTFEHSNNLDFTAKQLGLTVQSSGVFTRDKGGKDISQNTKIREAAFSNDVLMQQNNSDIIQLTPESILVLRVKSHVPASLLSVDAVKNQIAAKLKSSRIEEKMKQLAAQIAADLQSGKLSLNDVQTKYNLKWSNSSWIGRHVSKIDQSILDAAFSMPKPENKKDTFAYTKIVNGYAVVALSDVKDGDVNVAKEQYQAYAEQIQASQGMLEYELYKKALENRAKISID